MTLEELIDNGRIICPSCGNDADFGPPEEWSQYDPVLHSDYDLVCGACGWMMYIGAETNAEKTRRESLASA